MSNYTFNFSAFTAPTLLGPQKEFAVLHEKLEALVKSILDDLAFFSLTWNEAEIAAASSVMESAQLFRDQLCTKKVAEEQVVKDLEKGKGKEKVVEETAAVAEAAEEANAEEEEEAPMPKRKAHPTAKKSTVVESEVEQPMPKVGHMCTSQNSKELYLPTKCTNCARQDLACIGEPGKQQLKELREEEDLEFLMGTELECMEVQYLQAEGLMKEMGAGIRYICGCLDCLRN
ncbi:hypothetical protein BDR04DRAFT_1156941 [Suillus decipiens]|nr:hypothetical protein BDR04DRAFT_1156941 [Suillus decipiens]